MRVAHPFFKDARGRSFLCIGAADETIQFSGTVYTKHGGITDEVIPV